MSDPKIFHQKWEESKENDFYTEKFDPSTFPSDTVFVLAAGGTGGHVMPALSVGQVLTERGFTVFYVTDQRCGHYFENRNMASDTILTMPFAGLGGKVLKNVLPIIGKMTKGMLACKKFFKRIRPSVVVGFGGYSTFPPLMIASLLKIPFILYEPDSYLGMVTHFFAKKAKIIGTGFQQVKNVPKKVSYRWVGMPVRPEFKQLRHLPMPVHQKFTIVVIGGSQGTALFSTIVPMALALLPPSLQQKLSIIQHVRKELEQQTRELYKTPIECTIGSFFPQIWQEMHQADLIISRVGASTVAEILMLGKAALLIPYKLATNDHQKANALALVDKKSAWMMEEADFTAENLSQFLQKVMTTDQERQQVASQAAALAKENAAENVAQMIVEVLRAAVP